MDENCVLGGCIDNEFAAVLQQIPGGVGRVNIKCARCLRDNSPGQGEGAPHGERPSPSVFHLWLVSWWVGRATWFNECCIYACLDATAAIVDLI